MLEWQVYGDDALVADLNHAAGGVGAAAAKVVNKGALNIKREAQQFSSGLAHAPDYPDSITYDVRGDGRHGTLEAEIGPDKAKRQGALGNILEYGTVKNSPTPHLGPALERETPRFIQALADASTRLLR